MLKIDRREYSPTLIDKITFAGASRESWQKAAHALLKLAGVTLSAREVARITQQIGQELREQREQDAALPPRRELPSPNAQPVEIACVPVDGGRMRTRAPEQGRGVHEPAGKETQVAALWKMTGPTFASDPHPEPPRAFLDPQHVPQMVREIKPPRSEGHERDENAEKTGSKPLAERWAEPSADSDSHAREWPPKRIFRTWVATRKDVYGFGPLVAAEAPRRGFYDWQTRLGPPEKDTPDNDPRAIVAQTLTDLENNQPRRNDPQYRREGLPITSCLVESLIKELNHRVKGTEQFWNRPSAREGESILQVTASLLSDGDPLTKHILVRPGSLYYRRRTATNLAAASGST